METTLYANLARQTLAEKLDGSNFSWPPLIAGDTLQARLRFTKRIEGKNQLAPVAIADLYAAVARVDRRPLTGTFRLKVGPLVDPAVIGTNVTVELAAAADAAAWQAALNTLTYVTGTTGAATVTEDNGTKVIEFANNTAAVVLALANNELAPTTLLRVVTVDRGGAWLHGCRLIEAPVAMTSAFSLEAANGPRIERHRAGSDVDGATINEIQILTIPPDFAGAAEFERDGLRSRPFSRNTQPSQFVEILTPLADEDGTFAVDSILPNEAWIEFTGSMAATAQDLLLVEVVRAPAGDVTFSLNLGDPAVYELLRAEDNVEVYLHIQAIYEEVEGDGIFHRWSYLQKVRLARGVLWSGLDVDEAISFLTKPADQYAIVTDDQIITGVQHYSRAFPATLELGSTLLTHTHNLEESLGHVVVAENAAPGRRLVEGTDYTIVSTGDDQFELQLLAGGYFEAPIIEQVSTVWQFVRTGQANIDCLNALVVAFTTIGPRSAFDDHEHIEADIPTIPPKFADIYARLAVLEGYVAGDFAVPAIGSTGTSQKAIPHFAYLYPISGRAAAITLEAGSRLAAILPESLPRIAPRLYPAVHDATTSALATTLDGDVRIPASGTAGQVYENQTADEVLLDIGSIFAGEFATTDGETWYPVETYASAESSFYPAHLARTLYEDMVQTDELPLGGTMEMRIPLEIAILKGNTSLHCQAVIETAAIVADTTPGTPGSNLASETWVTTPHLAQNLILTAAAREYVIGYRVQRSSAGVLSAQHLKFGKWTSTTAPAAAAFRLRVRLIRLDTKNAVTEPSGLIAATGGTPFSDAASPDSSANVGFLTIS